MFDATFAKTKRRTGSRVHTCKFIHQHTACTAQWQLHHAVCEYLSVICKALQLNSSRKHIYTHTHTFPVPTSEERGCVVVADVTGSRSAQMTNRYNQLSRDPSCCCHSHYSWTNTYIKQSGTTGHYAIPTHTLISTHKTTYTYLTHTCVNTVVYT